MTPENNAKAIEMHCTGRYSSAKIAAHLGVHPATVQRYLRREGYELSQGRPMIHGATLRMIAEKRDQGVSWADLEDLMGFSGNQMRIRLKELPDRIMAVECYKGGMSILDTARTVERGQETVRAWLAQEGVLSPVGRPSKMTDEAKKKIESMADKGYTGSRIGLVLGIDGTAITRHMRSIGKPFKRGVPTVVTKALLDFAVAERGEGCTWEDIEARSGVSKRALQNAIKKINLVG